MSKISIVKPGLMTTIQDQGRIGYQHFGMPVAGAMDVYSLQLANLLVGNHRFEAALEITLMGPEISFHDTRAVAITGGEISATINDRPVSMYETLYLQKGDTLKLGNISVGCRSYLAISEGFHLEKVMGSYATYTRGNIGGFYGRKLMAGDEIPLNQKQYEGHVGTRRIPKSLTPDLHKSCIRVIMGPEDQAFTEEGKAVFQKSQYRISNQSDRMGYRLEGPKIQHVSTADIISGGINLGAIQVPGEGVPIIMMADRQTTGGYTKIANVISIDIPLVAQKKPGDIIKFTAIKVEEAQLLFREREETIRTLEKQFQLISSKIHSVREYCIKVRGRSYHVRVEELKDERGNEKP
ncbi:biotin-dependent carboxyltransferase family protein [Clostridium formicaceticum]|uniref:KipI antagonist n=1 Tax=Clostridium formicaceticum TaxID=1497 RepID=A0AAC9WFP5_9CLOT|nr:biotin-dependent carboxyltransferase family protein [Clostridium formicaceticum]AOY76500.1 hypothetical protein BJL90_11905 [Clostridium formicaceticum]ARE86909.1 KipI antagonist [Clostridium formicaceticum]